jgi:predicted ATP-grasp superfamily ATP-dependent carboligase
MGTVILTDAQLRKTLACARSLGSQGVKVIACEKTRFATAGFSKYVYKFLVYPNPVKKRSKFIKWLKELLTTYPGSILFPMDDTIMQITSEIREELQDKCILPYPTKESYNIASDKAQLSILCKKLGIDAPKTHIIKDIKEVEKLKEEITYPVIIKPRIGSGSRGIRIIESSDELLIKYLEVHKKYYPFPIIQEYLGLGQKYDVNLLSGDNNCLKASCIAKQVRLYPIKNGPSSVQESIHFPEIIDISKKILTELNWYGISNFEYMLDPKTNKPKIIEINTRFSNSIYITMLSGVDFPYLLYKLAIDKDFKSVNDYKAGIITRNLLPLDILHFIADKNRFKLKPSFFRGRRSGVYDDIISKDDPLPTLGFVLACFRYIFSIEMWKFVIFRK